MASARSEFFRFLFDLRQRGAPDDVLRVANIVYEHIDLLEGFGATRRARSVRLAPILLDQISNAPVQQPAAVNQQDAGAAIERISRLSVGPFRGFMRREVFDLSRDITLIYGANGTGKSSFFEALELAMIGSIAEAQEKRIDLRAYCNNARLGRHDVPELTSGQPDQLVRVQPNEDEHRFCFVEKNRIEDFARIAARTPGDQRQLIATLFGVEQFSEFVRGFNQSLDENLPLIDVKGQELQQRRTQLAASQQTVQNYPQRLAGIDRQEQELAQRISPDAAYQSCCDWLLGSEAQVGRLSYIRSQLDAVPPPIHGVTRGRLTELVSAAYKARDQWRAANNALRERATDVSYAQLYRAVQDLADGATVCPACGTDLAAVTENPFARAQRGLAQLAELAKLQEQAQELETAFGESVRDLWAEMRRSLVAANAVCPQKLAQAGLPELPGTHAGDWLAGWVDGDRQAWNGLLGLVGQVENADANARGVSEQRAQQMQERDRLQVFEREIQGLKLLREVALQEFDSANQTIARFDEANRDLIEAERREIPVIEHGRRVKAAYDVFLMLLNSYLADLPGRLLQGLGDQAKALYNAFNRGDPPGDLLQGLWLPVAENGKIEIEFVGEPGTRFDALMMLSEGHIKCLGLAILLAKNIAQGCRFVVFDDVVNAIDDDHRDGILRTFFEDEFLTGKQIILTSHAEEFLHRIQQELGARRAALIKRYRFLPHQGEHELRVDADPPAKNYVTLAQQASASDEKRDALRHSRAALESLTDRLWIWLGRRADGRISLRLADPKAKCELYNKCVKLRESVGRISQQHPRLPEVVAALDRLIGVDGTSIEWGYLNGGTHDAQLDHEFDRAIVQAIVESMTSLDDALEALRER